MAAGGSDARSSTVLGATIGRHRIVRLLGGGTVGRVFVCRKQDLDDRDDRQVAIKVLRTKYVSVADKLMRDRALVEKVTSPYVARVEDVTVYNNVPYVVMELVEGAQSLAARLEKGPLKSADALALARAVCLGLQAAWAQGVAHGDVRPQNILVPDGDLGKAKLTDFLLAAPVEGTESVRGAPPYLAPELLVGTPPDPLTDLYAVGCILYECLAGQPPFTGSAASVLHAQVSTPAPSLAASVPGPQGLVDLVDRLLEKDRAKRVKTYTEALEGIERALRGLSMPAPRKPEVPELEVDLDVFTGDSGEVATFDDQRTDEIHTSPAREKLISDEPRVVAAVAASVAASRSGGFDDDIGVHRSAGNTNVGRSTTVAPRAAAPAPAPAPAATTSPPVVEDLDLDLHSVPLAAAAAAPAVVPLPLPSPEPDEVTRIDPRILGGGGPSRATSVDELSRMLDLGPPQKKPR